MAAGKWIGGVLGFITAGPLGALAGYALGSLFEHGLDAVNRDGDHHYNNAYDAYSGQQHNGRQGFGNQGYSRQQSYEGERNSFMFSLLVLSSYIINADGKIMHSEMEMVRRFLRQNFGEAAKQQGEEILLKLFEQQKQMGMQQYRSVIQDSCHQIRANMMYEQRLQLLNFLVMIAQADGVVNSQEIQALKEDFYKNVNVPGSQYEFNQELEKALRREDFFEIGELMARDALNREESCGGHFRVESQTEEGEAKRDDAKFMYVAAWEYKGEGVEPELHKEPLKYEFIEVKTRNYKE